MAEYANVSALVTDINAVMQVNTTGDIEADEMKKILIGITELFVPVGSTTTIRSGAGAPAFNLGINGDIYIDTNAMYFYGPKTNGLWGSGYPIVGQQGPSGKSVLSGSGVPAVGTGTAGDFYIDITAWTIYGPKVASWGSGVSLIGPKGDKGDQGDPGDAGVPGEDGADGNTILNGTSVPDNALGVDGDFYYNTSTQELYGPKTGGVWTTFVTLKGGTPEFRFSGGWLQYQYIGQLNEWQNLIEQTTLTGSDGEDGVTPQLQKTATHIQVSYNNGAIWEDLVALADLKGDKGDTGDTGDAGTNGKTVLSGVVNPTTEGTDGDFYYRYDTYMMFGPKASGVWPAGQSLKGIKGDTGDPGSDGSAGIDGKNPEFRFDSGWLQYQYVGEVDQWQNLIEQATLKGDTGDAGQDGKTILSLTVPPTSGDGSDGDYAYDSAAKMFYGPKVSGAWPAGFSVVGPKGDTGDTGDPGTAGRTIAVYTSSSEPTGGTYFAGDIWQTP